MFYLRHISFLHKQPFYVSMVISSPIHTTGGIPCSKSGIPWGKSGIPCGKSGIPCSKSGIPCGKSGIPCGKSGIPCSKSGIPWYTLQQKWYTLQQKWYTLRQKVLLGSGTASSLLRFGVSGMTTNLHLSPFTLCCPSTNVSHRVATLYKPRTTPSVTLYEILMVPSVDSRNFKKWGRPPNTSKNVGGGVKIVCVCVGGGKFKIQFKSKKNIFKVI